MIQNTLKNSRAEKRPDVRSVIRISGAHRSKARPGSSL